LVTGAGGGVGGVGRRVVSLLRERDLPVRAFVHRDDDRAEALRALGADVFVGDLARPSAVAEALEGCRRMFFCIERRALVPRGGRDGGDGDPSLCLARGIGETFRS
jgi:uncharacterized protein YbjT (DUF2867 family)